MAFRSMRISMPSNKVTDCNDVLLPILREMTSLESRFVFNSDDPIRGFQTFLCSCVGLCDDKRDADEFLREVFDSRKIRDVRQATRMVEEYKKFHEAFIGSLKLTQYLGRQGNQEYGSAINDLGECFLLKLVELAARLDPVKRRGYLH